MDHSTENLTNLRGTFRHPAATRPESTLHPRRWFSLSICLALTCAVLSPVGISAVHGQSSTAKNTKKKTTEKGVGKTATKTAKKGKAGAEEEMPENPFVEIDFGAADDSLPEDGSGVDLDETPDGKQRLNELQDRAREIFVDRDRTDRRRRPLVLPRDRLVGEVVLLNQGIARAQQGIVQAQQQIRRLQGRQNNGQNDQAVRNEINAQEDQIRTCNLVIATNQDQISLRATEITALNLQIQPLDEQLLKLWLELNACRKQWLEIRQPQLKYAYGHFESLQKVIDDWLVIDGLWPDAYAWAAICNYELGNYDAAWQHVEKATELRQTLQFPKAWAAGEALRGLISAQIRDKKGKSAGYLQSAGVFVAKDKNTNWEAYFLLGRASFENDKMAVKAKTNFEKALKIQPKSACVQYWNGRLLTTSTVPAVRDVEKGTKTLETLWERSSKKSWRLSHALVLAYDAYDQEAKSKDLWDVTLELAPDSQHTGLTEARAAAAEKVEAMTASAGTSGSSNGKKSKTTVKADD